jgi:hypothetical protein
MSLDAGKFSSHNKGRHGYANRMVPRAAFHGIVGYLCGSVYLHLQTLSIKEEYMLLACGKSQVLQVSVKFIFYFRSSAVLSQAVYHNSGTAS